MSKKLTSKYARQFGTEEYENAYLEKAECFNCDDTDYFWIRKGLRKPRKSFKCKRCGCNSLQVQ